MSGYAELHAHSAFSFLEGANQPEELVAVAHGLGLSALALTDRGGLYGVVRFAEAARQVGLPTVFGAELDVDGVHLVILARGPEGYRRLSRALGLGLLASEKKGVAEHTLESLAEQAGGHWMILASGILEEPDGDTFAATSAVKRLAERFGAGNVAVELTHHHCPREEERLAALVEVARGAGVRAVVTGAVCCASPESAPIANILAATKANASLAQIEGDLAAAPAFLRSPQEMAALHSRWPEALAATVEIAEDCAFDLNLVAPGLPPFPVPEGHTESTWLRELTYEGAQARYGSPHENSEAYDLIEHELSVIEELGFCGYFLIVYEIVDFCRTNEILCQGRGSAANSAVCFSLGITAVDAVKHKLLFERFLSPGRSGPPDIDVDIEAARREEVIQFVYSRYGRHHAAQVANVISYRPRSAIRAVAKALGYDLGVHDAWAKSLERWGRIGADDSDEIPSHVRDLAEQMLRLPRHMGIHSGGMVICDRPVIDVVPVEWATMPGRTVVQWDKDDCADAGLVKFDLLGLGMLTALKIAFTRLRELTGEDYDLHSIPQEDPKVYDLLCAADTVGVFQVESRAQIATLPRLQPRKFYDIVVEVALIRPGPIQGQSVHPYIERRRGRQPITYLHPLLEPALEKTLGVPLFQEQLMQIAIDVAGFSPADADELRRAMSAKRSAERMDALKDRLFQGMFDRGVSREVAEEVFDKLKGFADFGFPESHAFSFAYLVYASAWLKVHHPEIFYAALLAAQPMGFYSPASLVEDARRRGIVVERASVQASGVQAEAHGQVGDLYVQLGLAPIRGIGKKTAEKIVAERARVPFTSIGDVARRCELGTTQLENLATAGAFRDFEPSRREALWVAGALAGAAGSRSSTYTQGVLPLEIGSHAPELPAMDEVTTAVADVWATGVSPDSYPTQYVRSQLDEWGVLQVERMRALPNKTRARVAGVVTHRQRPSTAKGVTFLSLEDETGLVNIICPQVVWARYRRIARRSAALIVRGMVEHADGVCNMLAESMTELPLKVPSTSRDFQ